MCKGIGGFVWGIFTALLLFSSVGFTQEQQHQDLQLFKVFFYDHDTYKASFPETDLAQAKANQEFIKNVRSALERGGNPNIILNGGGIFLKTKELDFNFEALNLLLQFKGDLKKIRDVSAQWYWPCFGYEASGTFHPSTGFLILVFWTLRTNVVFYSLDSLEKLVGLMRKENALGDVSLEVNTVKKKSCKVEELIWSFYVEFRSKEWRAFREYASAVYSSSKTFVGEALPQLRFHVFENQIREPLQEVKHSFKKAQDVQTRYRSEWIEAMRRKNNIGSLAMILDPEKKYYDQRCW